MQLNKKTILLTGASGGIGESLAKALAKQGANLIVTGRNKEALTTLTQSIIDKGDHCQFIVADIGTPEGLYSLEKSIRRIGFLDILINNAGISHFGTFDSQSDNDIYRMMQVNLISPMQLSKRLLPYLNNPDRSLIVNIGSTFGSIGHPGFVSYCTSKFGLRGFDEALSRELADTSIKMLYISPRATVTKINSQQVMAMNEALGINADCPTWVAEQTINAIKAEKRHLYLGWPEKLFVRINAVLPRIVAGAIIKQLPTIRHYLTLDQSI